MGVVRGDRIAESRKLNTVSIEAQTFYGSLVARCPDDFGRFRCEVFQVAEALFPRRSPTRKLFNLVQRLLQQLTMGELWRVWECDGITFAELTNWQPTGNHYHRTPEPPWSDHVHNATCVNTALFQAKQWTPEKLPELKAANRQFRAAAKNVDASKNGPQRHESFSQIGPSNETTYASGDRAGPGLSSSPSVLHGSLNTLESASPADAGCEPPTTAAAFVAEVLRVYTSQPGNRTRPTRSDQREAMWHFREGRSVDQVLGGIRLATMRRMGRSRDVPLDPINSLRYYRAAIAEVCSPEGAFVAHLRARLHESARPP